MTWEKSPGVLPQIMSPSSYDRLMPRPLGSYPEFTRWSGRPRAWGPDGRGRMVFGGGVMDDLVAGIEAHRAEVHSRYPAKAEALAVAVGCVMFLDHPRVVDALASLDGSCIVVDKKSYRTGVLARFAEQAEGVWQGGLPGLMDLTPEPTVIGPSGPAPGSWGVGPLCVAGWGREGKPLLHAKVLVLCAHWRWEVDTGYGYLIQDELTPMRFWIGSANWTRKSADHLEVGVWSDDEELCAHMLGAVASVVAFSEPFSADGPASVVPNPAMVPIEWDDDACREAAAQYESALDSFDY